MLDPHTMLALAERVADDDDPLGGVLAIWEHEDDRGEPVDTVEIVNFRNPARIRPNPAGQAIARATEVPGTGLRYVTLADLIALKFYAGGSGDLADIVQLLARNGDADLGAIRTIARPYDANDRLEQLISEASQLRRPR